ncbi:MAG: hypothetical protein NTY90_00230, partial [Candidatus Micrarchaeota archaeon]|nr:hypothetical protein [Candidatus Micrarchaeota archaeon]
MDFGEWWDSVNDSWQSFLEWAADKGLPLKALADALEEKGVPSLPALILILIAIIGGAALLVLPLLAPPTATVIVTVQGLDGTPLPNVNVYLASAVAEQVFTRMTEITDFEGRVIFRDVPTGTLVSLLAEPPSPEYSSEPVTFT